MAAASHEYPTTEPRRFRFFRGLSLWLQLVLAIPLLLIIVAIGGVIWLDSSSGHDFIVRQIEAQAPENGLRIGIDPKGVFLRVDTADMRWDPFAYMSNRLSIETLNADHAQWLRMPDLIDMGEDKPILPAFDILIGDFNIKRLEVAEAVAGQPVVLSARGAADIRGGRARIDLDARSDTGDVVTLALDAEPDRDKFALEADVIGPAGGALAAFAGTDRAFAAKVTGKGSWSRWDGSMLADYDGKRAAVLQLTGNDGVFTASGRLTNPDVLKGLPATLISDGAVVNLTGRYDNQILSLSGDARSNVASILIDGGIDFADSSFDAMRINVRQLDIEAILPDARAKNLTGRALLMGPLTAPRFDYFARADEFSIGDTGFVNMTAAGEGARFGDVLRVPVQLTATRVTGTGELAGEVLNNLDVDGAVTIVDGRVRGDNIRLRTDQIDGLIRLDANLDTGRYDVAAKGVISDFAIDGFGQVDLNADVVIRPDAAGFLTIGGRVLADMDRLDIEFLRELTGGLPKLETQIALGRDNIFRFSDFTVTAPKFRFSGDGVRKADGTFDIRGRGNHSEYGPLAMNLMGVLDRPVVELVLDRPFDAAELAGVRVKLTPNAGGFSVLSSGRSMLGPFDGVGQLLLPARGGASVRIDRLNVAGSTASGLVRPVNGALAGELALVGQGMSGNIVLNAEAGGQRVSGQLALADLTLSSPIALFIRQGEVDMNALFVGPRSDIRATMTARGVRSGGLTLGRVAAQANIVDGSGEVTASIRGTRSSGFELQANAAVSPNAVQVLAEGNYQRRPITLSGPARFVRKGDGWEAQPTQINYEGGNIVVGGEFGGRTTLIAADMENMPLQLLDLAYADLGFLGRASGLVSYQSDGSVPTGEVQLQIRNFSRSGLVLTADPADIAVNAKLDPKTLGMRLIVSNKGETVGRAQAVVSNLPLSGDITSRINAGQLQAQARYDGPAASLWRLTGVDMIDLQGDVRVTADVSGTVAVPTIVGSVATDNGRLESGASGTVVTDVVARGTFDGSRLVMQNISGKTAENGRVAGGGEIRFGGIGGLAMQLDFQADNALLLNRDDISAQMTGPLAMRLDENGGVISGNVVLNRSFFRLGQADVEQSLPQLDVRELRRDDDEIETAVVRSQPWRLAVKATAPDQLEVDGMGLKSVWSADLDISGQLDNPRLVGRADLVRGDFDFAGKNFRLDNGVIRFAGEVPANPTLDVSASASIDGLDALIKVTGRGQSPEISFSSNPQLPQEELLSRLLFGSSITELSAPEALQLAAAVASLQSDGSGSLDPINALREAAGLDRLRFLSADEANGQGTAIAAGKYITRNTYVEIVTDGKGYSATQIEFRITRWLSILSSISTLGRQSVSGRISKDY
jgi:translocation and assembly module TamB